MSVVDPDRIRGALLGVAVGDALGLACENLRPRTIARRFGSLERYGLFPRVGWISDDTEQTAMVAEALLSQRAKGPEAVARAFAWKLRLWFVLLPAGIGFATVRACLKLLVGFPVSRSGVRSAGNGASMRSVPIALACPGDGAEQEAERDALARAVARVTHTDPRGVDGARVVAHAAAALVGGGRAAGAQESPGYPGLFPRKSSETGAGDESPDVARPGSGGTGPSPGLEKSPGYPGLFSGDPRSSPAAFVRELTARVQPDPELASALERTASLLDRRASAAEAARELGTTGFVLHTVPFALFCAVRFDTFTEAVRSAVSAGGDTDTIAAIAGGLAGALHGARSIPEPWLAGLESRGRGRRHLEALAAAFAGERASVPRPSLAYRIVRAPFFVLMVLFEAFRRFLDAPIAIARGEWRS